MIKQNELYEVTITGTNINHYRQFYSNIQMGNKIQVTGDQVPHGSHMKIKYICDFCGNEYERSVHSEVRSGDLNACPKCQQKKFQLTCREKYGVDHPMQNEDVHRRSVDNHINNFGKEANTLNYVNGVPASKVQQ